MIDLFDHDDVFTYMQDDIKRLCARGCRGRWELMDDLMSYAYERVPDICETWDPNLSKLRTHVTANLRLYLWKWMNLRMRREVVGRVPLDDSMRSTSEHSEHEADIDLREEVQLLMSTCSEQERTVLELKLMREMTFAEVAYEMDISGGEVRELLRTAYIKVLRAKRDTR